MKKLFALLLSAVMLSSLLVGITFAATPTAVLNLRVSGTVALNEIITIEGSVLSVDGMPANLYHVVLQHRAPGGSWVGTSLYGTSNTTLPATVPLGPLARRLTAAGDYRIALTGNDLNTALTATGGAVSATVPALVHNIGTIAAGALAVTPGVTSVTWDLQGLYGRVTVPLTITRVVGGQTVHVPIGTGPTDAVVTVTYAGQNVPEVTHTGSGTANLQLTIDNPAATPLSGTLTITARTGDNNLAGSAQVLVAPRAAFNAVVTPATVRLGSAAVFTVEVFDALGNGPGAAAPHTFAYARATLAGPFTAGTGFGPIVITTGRTGSFVAVTPRHGGTITATIEFFDAKHNVLGTVVREVVLPGWRVELPVTSARRNDEATLRAIVTDAAGNRVNNARVRFVTVDVVQDMFSTRTDTGAFRAATAAVHEVVVNGMLPVQPRGSAVTNGEYSIDVLLRDVANIDVIVEAPVLNAEGTGFIWETRASWPGAIVVNPTLGYTLTLNHTLLAGTSTTEDVMVTVVDAAGAPVTTDLWFIGGTGLTGAANAIHTGGGIWRLPLNVGGAAGSFTIRAQNHATRTDATLEGSTTITAVAPTVTVTPDGGQLTANFYDVITVSVVDPRTNVAVARPITVGPRNVATSRDAGTAATGATTTIVSQRHRLNADASWIASSAAVTATTQQFELLAHTASLSIRGAVQTPQVRIAVAGAPAIDLTLGAATLVVTPAELHMDRTGTITVRLNDARGNAITGKTVTLDGIVAATDYIIPAAGTLSVVIRPTLPTTGVMPPSQVRATVAPDVTDRTIAPLIRATVPIVAAPADTARPTIEVTAPSVTTDASAMVTIVVRDNAAVTGVIFEGAAVSIFPAPTVTVLRTVTLREGLNSFQVAATDAAGNVAERIIVIERRLPAPAVHTITIGRANPAIGLDVPATVRNGRLMVPFRWFAERILNATVDFKVVGAAEIVTLQRGNMHVELTLNSTIAKVNGVPVALDVAPFATGGRTLVPARFVAETFGYIVNWNPVNDEVTFTVRP